MKKRINTNILDGFINQAISHNKYLEESEMWKKKKEEKLKRQGRMASDHIESDEDEKQAPKETKPVQKDEEIDDLKAILALYKDYKQRPVERWDHGGFMELYPNGVQSPPRISKSPLSTKKWDHEGYEKLYSEKSDKTRHRDRSRSRKRSTNSPNERRKSSDRSRIRRRRRSSSSSSSSSDEEKHRRKKRKKSRKKKSRKEKKASK